MCGAPRQDSVMKRSAKRYSLITFAVILFGGGGLMSTAGCDLSGLPFFSLL